MGMWLFAHPWVFALAAPREEPWLLHSVCGSDLQGWLGWILPHGVHSGFPVPHALSSCRGEAQ